MQPASGRGWSCDRPRPLSRRRRDPVRARRVRHFPQPEERHRHPDGDRADPARGEHQPGRLLGLPRRHGRAGVRDVRADRRRRRGGDRPRHPRHLFPSRGTIAVDESTRCGADVIRMIQAIVFLPLLAAIVAGLGNRRDRQRCRPKLITTGALFVVLRAELADLPRLPRRHQHSASTGARPGSTPATAGRLGAAGRRADRGDAGGGDDASRRSSTSIAGAIWRRTTASRASSPICRCSPSRC